MARPTKEGLDYFPLDVDIDQDDKLVVPIAKFGMEGYGIIVRLMAEVYKNGYYYQWGERQQYAFINKINVDINRVNEVVNECARWGFFDESIFANYQVLTSKGFQKRYLEASKRRKEITFIDTFTLVDLVGAAERVYCPINLVDANGNVVNVYINSNNANTGHTKSTQSKVKERRVKEKDIKTSSRKQKSYSEDDTYYRMAAYLHERIMSYAAAISKAHLVEGADMQKWADEFRKIVELDKRPTLELREVINWATADPFWQQNILSPKKLREKYTDLAIKSASKQPATGGKQTLSEKSQEEKQKIKELMERERIGATEAVSDHPALL